jgi:hypothetical protein
MKAMKICSEKEELKRLGAQATYTHSHFIYQRICFYCTGTERHANHEGMSHMSLETAEGEGSMTSLEYAFHLFKLL